MLMVAKDIQRMLTGRKHVFDFTRTEMWKGTREESFNFFHYLFFNTFLVNVKIRFYKVHVPIKFIIAINKMKS